ncbi:hypothetical protein G4B88_004731 [Cannabis sativa]|uniref:F-box domain-containing protein n=1 Tax=Cannabis sativa TaxID=3483 RepID=A0A7J6FYX1_CANSA|nr:hypothetical protein G4B88_004731 [Cannabis sativa]
MAEMGRFCDLPSEVVEKIMLLVPADSLVEFKSLNKFWYSCFSTFINDPKFAAKHLLNTKNQSSMSLLCFKDPSPHDDHRLITYPLLTIIHGDDDDDSKKDHLRTATADLTILLLDMNRWDRIYHCDGLLLLVNYSFKKTVTMVLCNPVLKESMILPKPKNVTFTPRHQYIGFEHDSRNNKYKCVSISLGYKKQCQVEVYTLGSHSWRVINMSQDLMDDIVGCELQRDFEPLLAVNDSFYDYYGLLAVWNDSVVMCLFLEAPYHDKSFLFVFTMDKDVAGCWTKYELIRPLKQYFDELLPFLKNDEILMPVSEDNIWGIKHLASFNIHTQKFKNVVFDVDRKLKVKNQIEKEEEEEEELNHTQIKYTFLYKGMPFLEMVRFCDLPSEVVEKIMLLVPADSLVECKSVNKFWYSCISTFIKDPKFVAKHLLVTKTESFMSLLCFKDPSPHEDHCLITYPLLTINHVDGDVWNDSVVMSLTPNFTWKHDDPYHDESILLIFTMDKGVAGGWTKYEQVGPLEKYYNNLLPFWKNNEILMEVFEDGSVEHLASCNIRTQKLRNVVFDRTLDPGSRSGLGPQISNPRPDLNPNKDLNPGPKLGFGIGSQSGVMVGVRVQIWVRFEISQKTGKENEKSEVLSRLLRETTLEPYTTLRLQDKVKNQIEKEKIKLILINSWQTKMGSFGDLPSEIIEKIMLLVPADSLVDHRLITYPMLTTIHEEDSKNNHVRTATTTLNIPHLDLNHGTPCITVMDSFC